MKRTVQNLFEVDAIVGALYAKEPMLKDSKFGYAYKRFSEKNLQPALKEYQADLLDARISNALEDEKTKAIITDDKNPRGYSYSKDGLKSVIKVENALTEAFNEKEIEITPFISTYVPELTDEEKEILTGLII